MTMLDGLTIEKMDEILSNKDEEIFYDENILTAYLINNAFVFGTHVVIDNSIANSVVTKLTKNGFNVDIVEDFDNTKLVLIEWLGKTGKKLTVV